ncbi:hypothetical protein ACF1BB_26975 [Streptomyces griseoluteus]|uniref:hypothetical protein n=1 Tax=Streptomyces griseoluteus TaxID=29306 RepID=UPI0036FC8F9B
MRTRARLAAVFTGLTLAGLAAPAAIADEGPASLDGVDTFGIANPVTAELVNDAVNQIRNES